MRRYRGSNIKIDWRDSEVMNEVGEVVDEVTKIGAEIAVELARRNLEKVGAMETGNLIDRISIRASKFTLGGYAIVAQGPGDVGPKRSKTDNPYYASFIELGGHYSLWGKYSRKKGNSKEGPYFEGRPYLRPAIKTMRRRFRRMMVDAIGGDK